MMTQNHFHRPSESQTVLFFFPNKTVLLPAECCQQSPNFYAVSHCFAQHPESC
jgi:hypothetical protein